MIPLEYFVVHVPASDSNSAHDGVPLGVRFGVPVFVLVGVTI